MNWAHEGDFRSYLQAELIRRCKRNPSYSIRAFANFLKCDYSLLAKLISGKRPIGPRTIIKLGTRLGLDPNEINRFRNHAHSIKSGSNGQIPQGEILNYQQLTADAFKIISDWYHYAILELMRLESFESDYKWIAKRIGISQAEVRAAADRLVRVQMLKINSDGSWEDTSGGRSTTVGNTFSAESFKHMQRQLLEKAILALDEVPIESRDQSSMTMSFRASEIDGAKLMIKRFRRQFSDRFALDPKADNVYALTVSFFPLLNRRTQNE